MNETGMLVWAHSIFSTVNWILILDFELEKNSKTYLIGQSFACVWPNIYYTLLDRHHTMVAQNLFIMYINTFTYRNNQ